MPAATTSSVAPSAQPAAAVRQRSFPLVALLQLATFCAALGACIDGAKLGEVIDRFPTWAVDQWGGVALAAAAFLGGLTGFFIGLGQSRMWRSAAGGAFVGVLCGLGILCVYIAPAPMIRALAAAAVLLFSTMIIRLRSA